MVKCYAITILLSNCHFYLIHIYKKYNLMNILVVTKYIVFKKKWHDIRPIFAATLQVETKTLIYFLLYGSCTPNQPKVTHEVFLQRKPTLFSNPYEY